MKTIYKYPFRIDDSVSVTLPVGAQILSIQEQNGVPCIWAVVDPEAPFEKRRFYVRGTGHPMPDPPWHFLATVQFGPLVFHFFEVA